MSCGEITQGCLKLKLYTSQKVKLLEDLTLLEDFLGSNYINVGTSHMA